VTIPPEERDPGLTDALKAEWPAILGWMVAGCDDWREHGLQPPAAVLAATNAYLNAEDAVAQWIEECCDRDIHQHDNDKELFASWVSWANACGEHPGKRKRLMEKLETLGFHQERNNKCMVHKGLKLKRDAPSWVKDD
jgi:putative DNA primase/helicase